MHKIIDRDSVARPLIRSCLRDRILEWIFEGRFRAGEHLTLNRLSQLFLASHTPIRESLIELAGLNMVEFFPGGRTIVRPFGPPQLRHMCHVLRTLETEAVRCACGNIPEEDLHLFQRDFGRIGKPPVYPQLKRRVEIANRRFHAETAEKFHGIIAERCGNSRLNVEVQRYLVLFAAIRRTVAAREAWNHDLHANETAGNLRIVKALLSLNIGRATRAMELYVSSLQKTLERQLFHVGQDKVKWRPAAGEQV